MRKKIISVVAAAAIVLTMNVSAFAALSSPVGNVEVTVKDSEETIITTTEPVKDSSGEVIDLGGTETAVVKITTVSQATNANAAAGEKAGEDTLTNNSRTVGQNENLIAENAKTANAATTAEALNSVESGLAKQTETYLKRQGMDTNLNNYAQAQTLEVTLNAAAEKVAEKDNGITLTMTVAGAKEGTKGFVQYYDLNGKAHLIAVTFGANGRISFKLPNSSIIRIFTAVPQV